MDGLALLGGATLGVSVGLAVWAVRPSRPRLRQVLERTHSPGPVSEASPAGGTQQWADRLGQRLLHTEGVAARLPLQDLKLLERSPAQLVGRCAVYAVLGLVMPQGLLAMLALLGTPPPVAFPVAASVLLGVVLGGKSLHDVREEARELREEYRYATAALLERAAMARVGDAGAAEALYRAASAGNCRALVRIRQVLEHSRYAGTSPWRALEQLGEDVGVAEVAQPARILALAGEEGATVHETLQHQASEQRAALAADRKSQANVASEQMVVPVLAVTLTLILFMAGPAFTRLMQM